MTKIPLADIKEKVKDLLETRDFKRAITRKKGKPLKLIAEIKKASPSRGIIREDFDPERIALIYEERGEPLSLSLPREIFITDCP